MNLLENYNSKIKGKKNSLERKKIYNTLLIKNLTTTENNQKTRKEKFEEFFQPLDHTNLPKYLD